MDSKYNDSVIRWTKIATIIFILLVVAADCTGPIITRFVTVVWADRLDTPAFVMMTVLFYVGTLFGYVVLFSVFKLLDNMSKDIVFDRANTKLMRYIGIGLISAGLVCAIAGYIWISMLYLTVVAFFMALIVLSVKIVFDKAITMKEDLDLTI